MTWIDAKLIVVIFVPSFAAEMSRCLMAPTNIWQMYCNTFLNGNILNSKICLVLMDLYFLCQKHNFFLQLSFKLIISFYPESGSGGMVIFHLLDGETEARIPNLLGNVSRLPRALDQSLMHGQTQRIMCLSTQRIPRNQQQGDSWLYYFFNLGLKSGC